MPQNKTWQVFQITDGTPNQYRYIIIDQAAGDSAIVEADLAKNEEIDTISDLESVLGGKVKIVGG